MFKTKHCLHHSSYNIIRENLDKCLFICAAAFHRTHDNKDDDFYECRQQRCKVFFKLTHMFEPKLFFNFFFFSFSKLQRKKLPFPTFIIVNYTENGKQKSFSRLVSFCVLWYFDVCFSITCRWIPL